MKTEVAKERWSPVGVADLEPAADKVVRGERSTLVHAGPGAGKTELLAQRACFLLQTGACPDPRRILAISFKRDAARNLRERVAQRCGRELAARFDSYTFDSFSKGIVDRFISALLTWCRPAQDYWHYVVGNIPPHKDPALVDRKLIIRYGLDVSKWTRARRKAAGHANVAYLRYQRFFVLLATQGAHLLFEEEGGVKEIRRETIKFYGYSIGCGRGSDGRYHASVKIGPEAFAELQAHLRNICMHRSAERIASEFARIRFIPYARVRRQLLRLLSEVNNARQAAGYSTVAMTCLNLRRTIYRPFAIDVPRCVNHES